MHKEDLLPEEKDPVPREHFSLSLELYWQREPTLEYPSTSPETSAETEGQSQLSQDNGPAFNLPEGFFRWAGSCDGVPEGKFGPEREKEEEMKKMRAREFVNSREVLRPKQMRKRAKMLGWWMDFSQSILELRAKTMDLAVKLFDYYCDKVYWMRMAEEKDRKGNSRVEGHFSVLDNYRESTLTIIACFFSAAKYNEIYPPHINDFLYFHEKKFTKREVILKEAQVAVTINFLYNRTLLTDSYQLLSNGPAKVPAWGYECLLFAPYTTTEELAKKIVEIEGRRMPGDFTKACATLQELGVEINMSLLQMMMERKCFIPQEKKEEKTPKK